MLQKISGYGEYFEIHTEPLHNQIYRLTYINNLIINTYLDNDYFKHTHFYIHGSILFNGEETEEAKSYAILIRSLMSAKYTKCLINKLNRTEIGLFDSQYLFDNLKASLHDLLGKISTHSQLEKFKKEVGLRLSMIYQSDLAIQKLVKSVMAELDTECIISDKRKSTPISCIPQLLHQAESAISAHDNHQTINQSMNQTTLNPDASEFIPQKPANQPDK